MKDREKKRIPQDTTPKPERQEKVSRREAMKRMAKGIALVGTLGVTAVVTQGQDECTGGYGNFNPSGYYNYSDAYYNYSNSYYNYNNYSNTYSNYVEFYYNYYDYNNYYNYYDYSNYQNYYDYYNH
jgi:hypothetical protein